LVKLNSPLGNLFTSILTYFVEKRGFEEILKFVKVELLDDKSVPFKACPLTLTQLFLSPLAKSA